MWLSELSGLITKASCEIDINRIDVERQMECTQTFPKYSFNAMKQLQNSDDILFIVVKFVFDQHKPSQKILLKQPEEKCVTEAIKLAQNNTAKKVEERQLIREKTTNDKTISLGSFVLLKKHEKGRCKIQDNWKPTPYKVVDKLNDNVYGIQLADGSGPIRNVTRTEILDTGTQTVEEGNAEDSNSFSEEWDGYLEISHVPETGTLLDKIHFLRSGMDI
ncbi:unnamed protein product [Mytilus edulis]|uniref:Uncharacterized protein n=1 Tax=Mytilus edulis TaxID=6550 RepID=A0A8S3V6T8_MYTED|nr:unnamed protein product [Mytilus edulis]